MTPKGKLWTPENAKIEIQEKGKMAIIEVPKKIPKIDSGTIFDKASILSERLHYLTKNKSMSYSLSGIIGVGKSTIPKIMKFYMEAEEYNEETNNLPLQLLYHDMFTYAFPFQLYVGERRAALNHKAKKDLNSKINDRAPDEDVLFTLNFVEMGAMSIGQYECVKDMVKKKIMENGAPDVHIWLQAKPETAYKRIQSRGIEYEAKGKNRLLSRKEKKEIHQIKEFFVSLVEKYAPSELKSYKIRQNAAGIPKVMNAGGVSIDYLRNLNRRYNSDFEDVLKMMDFEGVLLKLNVDDAKGIDRREELSEHVKMMEQIKNASFLSLYRKGYSIKEVGKMLELRGPFEDKKPYIK